MARFFTDYQKKLHTMKNEYEQTLLEIAKKAVLEELEGVRLINKDEYYARFPQLKEKGATFVTLTTSDGELRGCIGTLEAHRPLLEDIISNAKAAAFNDYRFAPLTREEFDDIKFEVSILSQPEQVDYFDEEDLQDKIIPFEDGIVLVYGGYRATFLPQVWEKLPEFDEFFRHLCLKAGLSANCLEFHPDIYKYNVKEIKED